MDRIFGFIFTETPWWLLLGLTIYGISWSVYGDLWKGGAETAAARARWCRDLRRNRWSRWYRDTLRAGLKRFDRLVDGDREGHAYRAWPPQSWQRAWSFPLLEKLLLLALAYPVLLLLGQWTVTGAPGLLGTLEVLPGGAPGAARYGFALALSAAPGCFLYAHTRSAPRSRLAWGLAGFGALIVALALALAFTGSFAGAFTGSFAGAFAVAFAVAGAFAGAGAGAVAAAFAGAFAGAGAFAIAIGIAIAIAVAAVLTIERLGWWTGRPAVVAFMVFVALLCGLRGVALLAALPVSAEAARDAASILFFLGFLPVLNGLADFLSVGATRHLLACSLRERGLRAALFWLADLAAGVAVLLLLGAALVVVGRYVTLGDGTRVFDIAAVVAGIRADSGAYWWLYIGLFSTLLPTVLHLALGSFGLMLRGSRWLRLHIAWGLRCGAMGDAVLGRWAVQWLCLSMTVTILAPLIALGLLIEYHAALGGLLLDLFVGFATLLGEEGLAPPPPPPAFEGLRF